MGVRHRPIPSNSNPQAGQENILDRPEEYKAALINKLDRLIFCGDVLPWEQVEGPGAVGC